MAAKNTPLNNKLSAKTLKLKGVIRLAKNFNYKSALTKAIGDKYQLKRAHD
jgi:hypothetical protein